MDLHIRAGGRVKRQKVRDERESDLPRAVAAGGAITSGSLQSSSAKLLVSNWAWGDCSAVFVQRICSAGMYDFRQTC